MLNSVHSSHPLLPKKEGKTKQSQKQTKKAEKHLGSLQLVGTSSLKDQIVGLQNTSPSPTLHHHITNCLFLAVPFTGVSWLAIKKLYKAYQRSKAQFGEQTIKTRWELSD